MCLGYLMQHLAWAQVPAQPAKPFVLGETHTLTSKVLGENRVLNIALPEGYSANDTTQYPVIYVLDGSADEDFIHIAGLVQFCSFEWVGWVPKSIVVGIGTVNRRRDFTFPTTVPEDKAAFPTAGHSATFIQFIETEVQPFIAQHYKTNRHKTLLGQSFGGLLATEVLFSKPLLFDTYVIVSPSVWWDNGSLLRQTPAILAESFAQPTNIYLAVGKEGLAPTAQPHVMEVDVNVLAEKLAATKSKAVRFWFDYLPEENHATILHQAALNAFRKMGAKTH